jgi:hypothetical protein
MFGFLGHMIFLFFSVCKRGERNERVKSAVTKKKKQKFIQVQDLGQVEEDSCTIKKALPSKHEIHKAKATTTS